jgi:hypothetical protein
MAAAPGDANISVPSLANVQVELPSVLPNWSTF